MSWDEISLELRATLTKTLTPRELDLMKLMAANPSVGRRPLAVMMGVTDTRIRDLQRSVKRKMAKLLDDELHDEADQV